MPSESQLKAQMQAAIAKKKQEAEAKAAAAKKVVVEPVVQPVVEAEIKEVVKEEVKVETVEPETEQVVPANSTTAKLTFFNVPIRYQVIKEQVYFAIPDALQLTRDAECHFKYLELRNNPATEAKVKPFIKTLAFDTEKVDGATYMDLLKIIRECNLTVPGPFGRWLMEETNKHKND